MFFFSKLFAIIVLNLSNVCQTNEVTRNYCKWFLANFLVCYILLNLQWINNKAVYSLFFWLLVRCPTYIIFINHTCNVSRSCVCCGMFWFLFFTSKFLFDDITVVYFKLLSDANFIFPTNFITFWFWYVIKYLRLKKYLGLY